MAGDLREQLQALQVHTRIAEQGLDANKQAILEALPPFPALNNVCIAGTAVLDWDHKLPSQQLILRVYGYHQDETWSIGERAILERDELIASRNHYPEFDLPDYDGIFSDEAYECALDLQGAITSCRLVSGWRRDVPSDASTTAIETVRSSPEFHRLRASQSVRAPALGDLEAIAWTPPCESDASNWTVDVWYLLYFDGQTGSGRSFLVDPFSQRIHTSRDFSVNAR